MQDLTRYITVSYTHLDVYKRQDMEIGPDEEMPKVVESAKLIQMVRGVEEVEKMDKLLSLAVTGGDFSWI